VIVPAHDEGVQIRRTLTPLERLASSAALDLVVVANGCVDDTVARASSVSGVRVMVLDEASKARALTAGDRAAKYWPRLYLDADIDITPSAVRAVFEALSEESVLAARPAFRYDTQGASWPVRAYYRARGRLPETARHLWGAGAYALSERGHARFAAFPDVVADDLFVDSLFSPGEIRIVETDPVVVRTPRDLRGLLAVLRRTSRGNAQLAATSRGIPATTTQVVRQLVGSARTPVALVDAAVYAALVVVGRLQARRGGATWDRDESSRGVAA
jgi:hypothetical protein